MRQFVFGLLVAVAAWWGYGKWTGSDGLVQASPRSGVDGASDHAANSSAALDNMLANATSPPASGGVVSGDVASRGAPLDTAPPAVDEATASAIDALLTRVQQHDVDANGTAWNLVSVHSSASLAIRRRLLEKLTVAGDGFDAMLAALGPHNGFLHSAEGRAMADKVLTVALSLPDPEAAAAGTRLLDLAMRGRIQKGDTDARAFVDRAYQKYRIVADRWVCDPANVAGARTYTVVAGDSLARIAKNFRKQGLTVEDGTLAVLNRIHNPNALQVGQKIKVPVAPIQAVLEKRSFALAVYVGDYLLRLYWVGHGENDHTPVTEFTIAEKQEHPEWTAPDGNRYAYGRPENILGEYFIKFHHDSYTGFGAHGTPMPETICTMSSAGCIRMLAPDIAELFKFLPRGAKLIVRATESLK